jgi:NTE family protein
LAREITEVVLALSGGGARGAYHLGVLHCLDEQNIEVKAICATSIGSIIAASYASGVSPKQQLELLKSKEIKKLFRFRWFNKSLFTIDMQAPILKKLVPVSKIEQLRIPLYITASDMQSGATKTFSSGEIHPICKASSALTPIFEPVSIDGSIYIDGGFKNHIPIEPLLEYNLPIIAVNLHPFVNNATVSGFYSYLKRAIVMGMGTNVSYAQEKSRYFIESSKLTDYSILSLKNFDKLFELGYQEAKRCLTNKTCI